MKTLEKDHFGENLSIEGKRKEEHLEISSTGYGLESVISSDPTKLNEKQQSTCGGL
ncbi:hypothetical protein [Metabacillus litoralis]|uniref:hypothetical protein n=1 Tax=Metabacillus litoralis TaxID=152268 RepID=UPI0013CEADCA|nr:hypothetical protein [Metabacillus litoralis]MCM3163940.1 hypothetical protein [Metabacillus litoralis]MCM3410436.1 hypothetical protein [Metabacillus litoralis]